MAQRQARPLRRHPPAEFVNLDRWDEHADDLLAVT